MENLSLEESFFECYVDDNTSRKRVFMFFYIFVIVLAVPSNAFALHVAWKHIRKKNELGVYLFNLALSDLSFAVGLLVWLDYLWSGVWVHGGFVCIFSINILFTNFYTSEALLCCIAFDRYLAVVHPFKYMVCRKITTATAVSAAIWVAVVCFNATTITWDDSYQEDGSHSLCFDIVLPLSDHMSRISLARFVLGLIVPVVLVMFSTWRIYKAVGSNQATEEQERKQIFRLLTVVLLCLLICFGPTHVIMLLQTQVEDCRNATWLLYLNKISVAISILNPLADPFLYCFITKSGKANVSQIILFCKKKRSRRVNVEV